MSTNPTSFRLYDDLTSVTSTGGAVYISESIWAVEQAKPNHFASIAKQHRGMFKNQYQVLISLQIRRHPFVLFHRNAYWYQLPPRIAAVVVAYWRTATHNHSCYTYCCMLCLKEVTVASWFDAEPGIDGWGITTCYALNQRYWKITPIAWLISEDCANSVMYIRRLRQYCIVSADCNFGAGTAVRNLWY